MKEQPRIGTRRARQDKTPSVVLFATCLLFATFVLASKVQSASPNVKWRTNVGSTADDIASAISYDGVGAVYVTGSTFGAFGGANLGSQDAFLAKVSTSGTQEWVRQFGSPQYDQGLDVSSDALGHVFVVGEVGGTFVGPYIGSDDGYIAEYDAGGGFIWAKQFGSNGLDWTNGVVADEVGNAYVTGRTNGVLGTQNYGSSDGFLAKFDAAENTAYLNQFGTASSEWGNDIARDSSGNLFVAGAAWGIFGPPAVQDGFLAKFDAAGNQIWSHNFGTLGLDQVNSVATDASGNAYIAGVTEGTLGDSQFGSSDSFVSKFDPAGNLLWTKQFGTAAKEVAWAVSADAFGNVYVGGSVATPATGPITKSNAYIMKFDAGGNELWTYNVPSPYIELVRGLAADNLGNVYAVGSSKAGPNSSFNVFVSKIGEIPEPPSIVLIAPWPIVILVASRVGSLEGPTDLATNPKHLRGYGQ
jgi:hypothetical protein